MTTAQLAIDEPAKALPSDARFTRARAVADAVLFEGYLLYPYRASAPKNRLRWQFGVVAPAGWSRAQGSDPWQLELQCLIEVDAQAASPSSPPPRVIGQLRFLRLRRRQIQQAGADGDYLPVPSLERGEQLYLPWDEGQVQAVELEAPVGQAGAPGALIPFRLPGSLDVEPLPDVPGAPPGRIAREILGLTGQVHIWSEPQPLAGQHRVHVRVQNDTPFSPLDAPRDQAVRAALLGTHLLLAVEGGRVLSLTDPPQRAQAAARSCRNSVLYPVLVEEPPGHDVVLAAPFILHDHPRIAPESTGDFYDATEIDELLTLRTLTLTDAEKREVRSTDPRVAALLQRVESARPEDLARLHGAFREPPARPRPQPGAQVRLRPGPRRTDAQDMFLDGRIATVEAVMQDVDGRDCLAVTVNDDPATELYRAQGRFLYFFLDEVEST